jgi:tRNA pseudouridine38-40 synthase
MPRYFLQLSYNGGRYNGWQIQKNTPRTVQQVLQETLGKMLPEKQAFITGCGRTDTGVHAKDFYAHFDTAREDLHVNQNDLMFKLNKALPHDIAIKKILLVPPRAHSRFDATARTYEYHITRVKNPLIHEYSWFVYGALDVELMQQATKIIFNTSNFKSFAKSNDQPHDNDCIMHECSISFQEENLLVFRIKANRFLRNMVRAITGTLVELGKAKITLEEFEKIISEQNRSSAGVSAPAQGLFLVKVDYPESVIGHKEHEGDTEGMKS